MNKEEPSGVDTSNSTGTSTLEELYRIDKAVTSSERLFFQEKVFDELRSLGPKEVAEVLLLSILDIINLPEIFAKSLFDPPMSLDLAASNNGAIYKFVMFVCEALKKPEKTSEILAEFSGQYATLAHYLYYDKHPSFMFDRLIDQGIRSNKMLVRNTQYILLEHSSRNISNDLFENIVSGTIPYSLNDFPNFSLLFMEVTGILRRALLKEEQSLDMLASQCGIATARYLEVLFLELNPQTENGTSKYFGNSSNSIKINGMAYSYPLTESATALFTKLIISRDIHHLGILVAFFKSALRKLYNHKKFEPERQLKRDKPAARLHTSTPLADFVLPGDVDGKKDHIQVLHSILCKDLASENHLRKAIYAEPDDTLEYAYESGFESLTDFIVNVEHGLDLGGFTICLVTVADYLPNRNIGSPRHAITIVGKDGLGRWQVYDPAQSNKKRHYYYPEHIHKSLYNQQYYTLGLIKSTESFSANPNEVYLSSEEIKRRLNEQLVFGLQRSYDIGFENRVRCILALQTMQEELSQLLDELPVRSYHLNSFPGNLISALQYVLMEKNLLLPTGDESVEDWQNWFRVVLSGRLRSSFKEQLLRPPTFTLPSRYLAIPYLITQYARTDPGSSITALDVGSGLLAGMAFATSNEGYIAMKENAERLGIDNRYPNQRQIPIFFSVTGIELSEPEAMWALASFDPGKFYDRDRDELQKGLRLLQAENEKEYGTKFNMLIANFFSPPERLKYKDIDSCLSRYAVISSIFVHHQAGRSWAEWYEQILTLLEEGGIWITAGFETYDSIKKQYKIEVFRKTNNSLEHLPTELAYAADQKTLVLWEE